MRCQKTSSQKTSNCRICGSKALSPVLSFTARDIYALCDPHKDEAACGHIQRRDHGPVLQKTDQEAVEVSFSHRHRLRTIATSVMEMLSMHEVRALDIGSGDGTLASYYPPWVNTVCIDRHAPPANKRAHERYIQEVFPSEVCLTALAAFMRDRKFDIITAIDVLSYNPDPGLFLTQISELLGPDGISVIELPYAALSLTRDAVGSFHDEAHDLFTLASFERLVRQTGLKIIRGAMTDTAGGALRLYLTHETCIIHDYAPWLEQLARLWDEEQALSLTASQTFQAFYHRFEANRLSVDLFVEQMDRHDAHAVVIGTGAAMQAQLRYFDLDETVISAIASNDPQEWGRIVELANGAEIDVISFEEAKLLRPDYLIAPPEFRREFLERWRDCIYDGVKFVFLTPTIEIIDEMSYAGALGRCLAVTDAPGSLDTLRAVLSTAQAPRLIAVNDELAGKEAEIR